MKCLLKTSRIGVEQFPAHRNERKKGRASKAVAGGLRPGRLLQEERKFALERKDEAPNLSLSTQVPVCPVLFFPASSFPPRLLFLSLVWLPHVCCAVLFLFSRYDAVPGESDGESGGARQLLEATKCRVS